MSRRLSFLSLSALAVAVYANTLGHGFVFDDVLWVGDQSAIRSLKTAAGFFSTGQLWNRVYRPLAMLSFSLDHAVAGLRPWFYHAENILLHAGVTALVYRLLRPLGAEKAWLAAALFAVLPVHSEVVASITSRSELLATLLGLLALSQIGRPVLACGLLVLALLAKESAVAFPALAVVLWWRAPDRLARARMISGIIALAVAVVIYLSLRAAAHCCDLFPPQFVYDLDNPLVFADFFTRVRTGVMILSQNLALCIAPHHLSADYSFPQTTLVTAWMEPRLLAWSGLLLAALAGAGLALDKHPDFGRGLAWFLIALAPVSNIPFAIGTIRAERLLYLPSVGTCLVLAEAIALLLANRRRWAVALTVALISSYGAATIRRNVVWRSQETLLTANVADAPRSAKAYFDLGVSRMFTGDAAAALPYLKRATEIQPDYVLAQGSLAACLEKLGDIAGAEQVYRRMFRSDPGDQNPAAALVRLCSARDDWHCVAQVMRRLLAANPDAASQPDAWVVLGNALLRSGALDDAENAYRRGASLGPAPVAHFNLAGIFVRRSQPGEAVKEYQLAEQAGLQTEELYLDWASALERAGDAAGARRIAARGLARFPTSQRLLRMPR